MHPFPPARTKSQSVTDCYRLELLAQSSSKIWNVFCRIVSMTLACQPASAMFGPVPEDVLGPIRVGLSEVCQYDGAAIGFTL